MSPVVPHFELSEEPSRTGPHVIRVSGEIHVSTAPHFAQRLSDVIFVGRTSLVLDMTGVEFIDSTGLSVLLNALRLVSHLEGGGLALVCTNPTVLRLFQITNLDKTFAIFDDRAKAIAYLQSGAQASTADEPADGSADEAADEAADEPADDSADDSAEGRSAGAP